MRSGDRQGDGKASQRHPLERRGNNVDRGRVFLRILAATQRKVRNEYQDQYKLLIEDALNRQVQCKTSAEQSGRDRASSVSGKLTCLNMFCKMIGSCSSNPFVSVKHKICGSALLSNRLICP